MSEFIRVVYWNLSDSQTALPQPLPVPLPTKVLLYCEGSQATVKQTYIRAPPSVEEAGVTSGHSQIPWLCVCSDLALIRGCGFSKHCLTMGKTTCSPWEGQPVCRLEQQDGVALARIRKDDPHTTPFFQMHLVLGSH